MNFFFVSDDTEIRSGKDTHKTEKQKGIVRPLVDL